MRFAILFLTLICFNSAIGQRLPVDRNTGKPIPCVILGCEETDSAFETENRTCLNCFYRVSDSTMQAVKNRIFEKCKNSGKSCLSFKKEQELWEANCQKAALKEGNKYSGGTMEMTEYIRKKLIMTNARIVYLEKYLNKLG